MDWLGVITSSAAGALLALAAKELIDLLRSERAHNLELKKRYFDVKLGDTLAAIRRLKTTSSALKEYTSIIREDIASGGAVIHPTLMPTLERLFKASNSVNEQTQDALSVLQFYYDDASKYLKFPHGILVIQKTSEFIHHTQRSTELTRQSQDPGLTPENRDHLERMELKHTEQMVRLINELASLTAEYDDLIDEFTRRTKADFKKFRN